MANIEGRVKENPKARKKNIIMTKYDDALGIIIFLYRFVDKQRALFCEITIRYC